MEHRWYQRFATDLAADLLVNSLTIPCRIGNFSAGGVFVRTLSMPWRQPPEGRQPLPPDRALQLERYQTVHLLIPLTELPSPRPQPPIHIMGYVVHQSPEGIGIEAARRVPTLPIVTLN